MSRGDGTLLYAEDDEADRILVEAAIEASGAFGEVRYVHDGEELLDYLKRRNRYREPGAAPRPGLVLLDLNMPKMDGREALRQIRQDPELKRLPVVVLTTSKAHEDIMQTYELGVSGFITKPSTFDELVAAVDVLGRYWFELVQLPPA